MLRKLLKAVISLAVIASIATIACLVLAGGALDDLVQSETSTDVASTVTNSIADATLEASGIKDQVQAELESRSDSIAMATGLTQEQVDEAISGLGIADWHVATLPADATAVCTVEGASLGFDGSITLYDDPSYATVSLHGQTLTFSIPAEAHSTLLQLAGA